MTATDGLLANAERYASGFDRADAPARPSKEVAVVVCMDARVLPGRVLGLEEGDAHVIRNAGGVVTEDVIRSLCISQCLLGTREVMVVHHTRCGMQSGSEVELKDQIEAATGTRPEFDLGAFDDVDDDVRRSLERIRASAFVPHKDRVRGFVYDVDTGTVREVS